MTGFIRKPTKLWLRALFASVISGGANNILASAGIGLAGAAGIKVEPLSLGQIGALLFSGACVGLAAYLVKSPMPPTNGTDFFRKESADIPTDPPQYPRK